MRPEPFPWHNLILGAVLAALWFALVAWMQSREMTADSCREAFTRYLTPAQLKRRTQKIGSSSDGMRSMPSCMVPVK